RIIYDDVGCWNVRDKFFNRMKREGIEVKPFIPVRFPALTSKVIFLYNFRCRTRIAGGFMVRDYVTNQSKDNN
ncbi:MAG: hypothetical protein ACFNXX_06880, partial [Veillonella parvula]